MKKITGPYAVLLTPFDSDKLDEKSFIAQVQRLSGTKLSGYVVNGSTAEFTSLSFEEQMQTVKLVTENKPADKQTIVSACTANTFDTLRICSGARDAGADAALICPKYYFKYTEREIKDYFLKVADKSPIPIILYNIPFFTQEIRLETIFELSEHPNVIGVKDSSANMKRLLHTVEYMKEKDFSVLTGTDDILYPAIFAGVDGSFTAFATIFPDDVCGIYDAVKSGNYEKAKEIQFRFMPLLRKADSKSFPKGYKELMQEVSGIKFGDKEI